MIKKNLIWLITAIMIILPQQIFAAEGETKEITLNVAQSKTLFNADGTVCTAVDIDKLVDGNIENGNHTHNAGIKEVIVDLGRKYDINEIKFLYQCGWHQVGVYVTNNADGSDGEKLMLTNIQDTKTWTLTPQSGKAYRYIKLTSHDHICFRELYVYTTMTVTEISRNKPATASSFYSEAYGPHKAVDGKNEAESDAWVPKDYNYEWLQLDLGEEMNIGYVEIESRNGSSDRTARMNFSLYGSNISDITDSSSAEVTGAVKLASLGESPFPEYDKSDAENTLYRATFDDSAGYRYFTYKKDKAYAGEIGEMRVYVINPTVVSHSISGRDITLTFSEDMNGETVKNVNIISKNTGNSVDKSVLKLDERTYILTMASDMLGDELTVDVSGAKNLKNVSAYSQAIKYETEPAMQITEVLKFTDSDAVGGAVISTIQNAQKAGAEIKFKNNMTEESDVPNVIILAVLFDSNNTMVAANEFRKLYNPLEEKAVCTGIDLSGYEDLTGYTMSVFVWNNFKDMKPWTEAQSLN